MERGRVGGRGSGRAVKTEEQKVYRGEERRGDGDIPGREPEGREKITVFSQVGPQGEPEGEKTSGGSGTGESERRKTMLCSAKGPPKYSPAG